MIDKATVDKIYLAASIVDVVGDFVSLNRKGTNYQACCPFHDEKTPSFVVSPSKGIYKCFGCGKAGNAVTFVMQHENMTYSEALKYLAKKYGIEVQERELTESQKESQQDRESILSLNSYATKYFIDKLNNSSEGKNLALTYFIERGFTAQTIEKFQLGFSPQTSDALSRKAISEGYNEKYLIDSGLTIKNDRGGYYDRFCGRVIFPIHSLSGSVLGFGGRILADDKKKAKYLNSPESEIYHKSKTLYGIYYAKGAIVKEDKCILVEGYTDVISMSQSGIENVVASSGTALTIDQIKLIGRFTRNVTVIYDGDSAGIKASLRGIDLILAQGLNVRVVSLPEGEDPDSYAKSHTSHQTKTYIAQHEEDFISFKTKLLIGEVANDPLGRAEVITDIINSIAVIPDDIVRRQFARQCSRLLEESEEAIINSVNRKVALLTNGEQGARHWDYIQQKQRYQDTLSPTSPQRPKRSADGQDIEFLEKEIISYLLKFGSRSITVKDNNEEDIEVNIAQEIIEELNLDEIRFESSTCQIIFDEYTSVQEQATTQDDRLIMDSFINYNNPDVSQFVIDIIAADEIYRQSKMWIKLDRASYEEDSLGEAIPKTLAIYKLKILEKLKNDYLVQLKAGGDNLEVLRHINIINTERRKTLMKYSRII